MLTQLLFSALVLTNPTNMYIIKPYSPIPDNDAYGGCYV